MENHSPEATTERRKMITRSYELRFNTPAFLGDAEKNGRWRTPPFKALLRQWWRVAAAPGFHYDFRKIREAEGKLFGHAWLENDLDHKGKKVTGRKSEVRMRLSAWDSPYEKRIKPGFPLSYAGYGRLENDKGALETWAIQAGSANRFTLAYPQDTKNIREALALADMYGTLGGRSRNAWGSLELTPENEVDAFPLALNGFIRNWREALAKEWAHAIGADDKGTPLVWTTKQGANCWEDVMEKLSDIRKQVNQTAKEIGKRQWVNRPVKTFNDRIPNSLRFKIRQDANGKLYGVIFHMPCKPPAEFRPNEQTLIEVWSLVHAFLDNQSGLQRSAK